MTRRLFLLGASVLALLGWRQPEPEWFRMYEAGEVRAYDLRSGAFWRRREGHQAWQLQGRLSQEMLSVARTWIRRQPIERNRYHRFYVWRATA